jgi:hypothetical protein
MTHVSFSSIASATMLRRLSSCPSGMIAAGSGKRSLITAAGACMPGPSRSRSSGHWKAVHHSTCARHPDRDRAQTQLSHRARIPPVGCRALEHPHPGLRGTGLMSNRSTSTLRRHGTAASHTLHASHQQMRLTRIAAALPFQSSRSTSACSVCQIAFEVTMPRSNAITSWPAYTC